MGDTIPDYTPKKQCSKCHLWLSFSNFSTANSASDKLHWQCKACINRSREKNPTRERAKQLRLGYNMTLQQYDQMFAQQGGVCAICKRPETHRHRWSDTGYKALSVDHDHKTGDVRALLCASCNMSFGMMNEDPERIQALLAYAEWCQMREPDVKIVQLPLTLAQSDIDK